MTHGSHPAIAQAKAKPACPIIQPVCGGPPIVVPEGCPPPNSGCPVTPLVSKPVPVDHPIALGVLAALLVIVAAWALFGRNAQGEGSRP